MFIGHFGLGMGAKRLDQGGAGSLEFDLYLSRTRAKNWLGHVSLWSLITLLAVFYVSGFFSPPPSSTNAMGWMGMIQWLLIAWAYGIDRTRVVV